VLVLYCSEADLIRTGDLIVSFRTMTFSRKEVPYSSALFWLLRWKYNLSSTKCQGYYTAWSMIWQDDYSAWSMMCQDDYSALSVAYQDDYRALNMMRLDDCSVTPHF
jgi:hypothetical protein